MPENDFFSSGELDFLEIIEYLLKRWYYIIAGVLLGASFACALVLITPDTYTSYASIFIQSETLMNSSLSEVQLETKLSQEYIELADSKAVMDIAIQKVKKETGIELTRKEIEEVTDVTNSDDSRLLVFNVTTDDPKLSEALAEAMAKSCAEEVSSIMNTDEPTIVDHAEEEEADSKEMVRKVAVGGIAGLLVVIMILIVLYLADDKVKTEEDVRKYLDTIVIGSISLDKGYSYKKKKKKKKKEQ